MCVCVTVCVCVYLSVYVYVCVITQGSEGQSDSPTAGRRLSLLYLTTANLLMTMLLLSALYHNCSVTTRDGVEIPLREAIHNIVMSPWWADTSQTVLRLLYSLVYEGPGRFIYELRLVLDAEGELSAYKVSTYC